MTSLTFYGGVGEIGGNKILLKDQDTQIFLDFGMSFNQSGLYFSDFMNPRKCNGMGDYFATGLLPDIPGVYREDYLRHMGRKTEDQMVDAVLISHAHIDHIAYVHHLRKEVELVMSKGSKAIMQTFQDIRAGGENDLLEYVSSFKMRPAKRGDGYTRANRKDGYETRPVQVFEYSNKFKVGDLEVVAYEVDHSLPGATAYLIHASEGSILYTGDYRFHGYLGDKTREMISEVSSKDISAVITEGTRIESTQSTSEKEVYASAKQLVQDTKGLVVTTFPIRDLTRFRTFHKIAKETGRKLVISFGQAYLLDQFAQHTNLYPGSDDPNLCLFAQRKSWGIAGRNDVKSNMVGVNYPQNVADRDYKKWEQVYLHKENTVNYCDLTDQSDFILICSYFQLNELIDIQPVKGSKYIRSITEPFNDDMKKDAQIVKNWLDLVGLDLYGMRGDEKLHASGHANGREIIDMLEELSPKTIFPIHTSSPKFLKTHFDNVNIPVQKRKIQL
jgi:ribonuclease J